MGVHRAMNIYLLNLKVPPMGLGEVGTAAVSWERRGVIGRNSMEGNKNNCCF